MSENVPIVPIEIVPIVPIEIVPIVPIVLNVQGCGQLGHFLTIGTFRTIGTIGTISRHFFKNVSIVLFVQCLINTAIFTSWDNFQKLSQLSRLRIQHCPHRTMRSVSRHFYKKSPNCPHRTVFDTAIETISDNFLKLSQLSRLRIQHCPHRTMRSIGDISTKKVRIVRIVRCLIRQSRHFQTFFQKCPHCIYLVFKMRVWLY